MSKGKYRIGSLDVKKGMAIAVVVAILAMTSYSWINAGAYNTPCPIIGRVYDENGSPVAGAVVRVRDLNTGAWGENVTDSNGNYSITLGGSGMPWTEWFDGDLLLGTAEYMGRSGSNTTVINATKIFGPYQPGYLWLNITLGTPITTKHIGDPNFTKYDYDNGSTNSGALVSDIINITADVATLSFWTWWQIEGVNPATYDFLNISISIDGGSSFTLLKSLNPSSDPTTPSFRDYMYYGSAGFNVEPTWVYEEIDISAYVPNEIVIMFSFDTNDSDFNYWEGWYIDDITITEFGGSVPFEDDVENGVGNWTYTGFWHISDHRSHSSSHAWYYGIEHSYVTSDTPFNFTVEGNYTSILYNISNSSAFTGWHAYTGNFTLAELSGEEGLYWLSFYAVNGSNSEPMHTQSHIVDNSYPESTYEFGEPNANLTYEGHNYTTIKICTPLWINATDGEGAGVAWLNYSVWWNPDEPDNYQHLYDVNVQDNDENDTDKRVGFISVALHFNEECFHEIKWQMVDYLGHESPQHFIDIAVDATAPNITKEIGEPKYIDGNITWVNCHTPVWINVTDDGCSGGVGVWRFGINFYWNKTKVPPGQEQLIYPIHTIVVEDGGELDLDGEKNGEISFKFHFWQDCFHEPEFWAVDYVGNNYTFKEKDLVDCTPPNVTKTISNEYVEIATTKSVDQQQPYGLIFFEDFEDGMNGWTVEEGSSPNGDTWALNYEPDWTSACDAGGASGAFMEFDDDDYGDGSDNPLEYLISPVIDCTGFHNISLDFDGDFEDSAGDGWFRVDVSNDSGATWHTVLFETDDVDPGGWDNYTGLPVNISTYADNKQIMIRFVYSDLDDTNTTSGWAWGCLVDNIRVFGEGANVGYHELGDEEWKDYQSFVPSVDYLDAISLLLHGPGEAGGAVTVALYNSTYELIASNTTMLGEIPEEPLWYQFHFEPTVDINPCQTYYIVVTSNASDYYWCYAYSDDDPFHSDYYVKGCGRMDGYVYEVHSGEQYPFDWTFKTEYYEVKSFVNTSSVFTLSVRDEGCMGGVGLNETFGLQYRIWWWNTTTSSWQLLQDWTKYTEPFTLNEECTHRIEMMAKDKLGNVFHYNQTHHVDESPPKIFKWHYGCHEEFAGGMVQPLNESFEDVHAVHPFPPAGWLLYNRGDDTHGETWIQWVYDSQHGDYSAACHAGGKYEAQDEWLVTPRILLQEEPVFSFWHKAVNGTDDTAPNEIWISETGPTPNDFINNGVKLAEWLGNLPNDWTKVTLDDELLPYVNKSVWIAFRYQSTDGEIWMIDNVTCTGLVSVGRYMQPWDIITLEVRDMPEGECAVGLAFTEIFWRYEFEGELRPYGEDDPLNYYYGDPVIGKDGLWWWHTYDNITNITFYEECRHDLYYYYNASDLLGNTINSTIHHQVYYVDQTEPVIEDKIHPPCYWPIVTNETIFYDNMENWTANGYMTPAGWWQKEINASIDSWTYNNTEYHSPLTSAFHDNDTAYEPAHPVFDDWLITPLIVLPDADEIELVFWEKNDLMDKYMHHGVYISLAGADPDPNGDGNISDGNYTLLAEFSEEASNWTERHVDLTAYAGHAVYIAFRYIGNDSSKWWIDDVEIRAATENPGFIRACAPIYLYAKDYPQEKAIDQQQEEWNTKANIFWPISDQIYVQTFTAGEEQLDAVDLLLNSTYETNVTVMIFEGTPMEWWKYDAWLGQFTADYSYFLGEVTKHIPPIGNESTPVWWQFHFVPSINLVPGKQYSIVVFSEYPSFWAYENMTEDTYEGGCAWYVNYNWGYEKNETWDFAFRTKYWTGEESICESGIQDIFYRYEWWNESSEEWVSYPTIDEKNASNVINISQFYDENEIWRYFDGYYLWYIYNETTGVHFYENCTHRLYYWTKDNVCHHSYVHMQTYYVDDEIPVVNKTHPKHGYYTPVEIIVDPTFANETNYWLDGTFHVRDDWSWIYDDGWDANPPGQYHYKKQVINFTIINHDLNHTLHLILHIEEIVGDAGITFVNGSDVNSAVYEKYIAPGGTAYIDVEVYDYWNFLRWGVWRWWAEVENVTQYLRAGARINLSAYDPPGYKVVDQYQIEHYDGHELNMVSQPPLDNAQEFIPNATRLDAVQLLLRGGEDGANVTVTILAYNYYTYTLYPAGSSTMYIPSTAQPQWYQFHFDPPIPLMQGWPYYIAVSVADEEGSVYWYYEDGDVYTAGDAWQDGQETSIDWTFKTEYYPGCPSGIENIYWRYEWNDTLFPQPGHPAAVNGSLLSDEPEIANYWWYIYDDEEGIVFTEECKHDLYYFAKDMVCHNSTVHHQIYYVDASEPIVEEILPEHGAIGNTTQSLFEDFYVSFDNGWAVVNGSTSYWDIKTNEPYLDYIYHYTPSTSYSGRYYAFAWKEGGTADSWLITPRLTIPEDGNLTFWYRTYYGSYEAGFEVCINNVTDDQTDTSAFVPIWSSGKFYDTTYRKAEIDLSAYAGQQVYIAFHCNYLEQSYYYGGLIIEDVWVGSIHRVAKLLDDDVESGIGNWTIEDLTVTGSYWQAVERVPVYEENPPAPAVNCFDGSLGTYNTFGLYGCNWNDTLTMKNPINLSDVDPNDYVWFNFTLWLDISGNDMLCVDISIDGENWTQLASWNADVQPWVEQGVNISDYIGNETVWLRFRFVSDDSDVYCNGAFIDNVTIQNSSHVFFYDNFGVYGAPSMDNWIGEMLETSKWHIVDDEYHSFNHSWWNGDDGTGKYLSCMDDVLISPEIDLSGYSYDEIMLTFWHTRDFDNDWGDYGRVEMRCSYDGTTWTSWYYGPSYHYTRDWVQEFIDLSDYVGYPKKIQFRFRFISDSDGNKYDGWLIDDIKLELRNITETTFSDNFERDFPPAGWTIYGNYAYNSPYGWDRYQTPEYVFAAVHGYYYKYGDDSQDEWLVTPTIENLPKFSNLTFAHNLSILSSHVWAYLYISVDGGSWQWLKTFSDTGGQTVIEDISLWPYHGHDIRLAWRFVTSDGYGDQYNDWWTIEWVNITSLGFLRACAPVVLNATDMPENECRVGVSALYWRYEWSGIDDGGVGDEQVEGWEIPGITNESNPEIADYTWWVIYDNGDYDNDSRIGFISFELHLPENCTHDLYYFAKDRLCHSSELHHERWYVDGTPPETDLGISWGNHPWIPRNHYMGEDYLYTPSDVERGYAPEVICIYDDVHFVANHTRNGDEPCIYPYNWQNNTYYRWRWWNESSGKYEFWPTPETPGAINGSEIVVSSHADMIQFNNHSDFWVDGLHLDDDDWAANWSKYIENYYGGYIWWMPYSEPFYFEHGCNHTVYYFSKDDLCNTEEPNEWHVGVDDMPPTSEIDFDIKEGSTVHYDEEDNVYYFQNCTWFIINTTDMPSNIDCQTGVWYINYTVWKWITNEVEIQLLTNEIVPSMTVYIGGEVAGYITSWVDSDHNDEWNYCDYMYIDWQGMYESMYNDSWFHVEDITFTGYWTLTVRGVFGDAGAWEPLIPWTVANASCLSTPPYDGIYYDKWYDDDGREFVRVWIHLGELMYNRTGKWDVCGKYEIHWKIYDYNNMTLEENTQDVAIDCTPPRTTKEFSMPYVAEEIGGGEIIHWVSPTTKIWLNGTDDFIWDSGVNETWYMFLGEEPILLWKYGDPEHSKHWFTVEEAVKIILNDSDATVEDYFAARPGLDPCKIELYHWSVDNVSHVEEYEPSKQHLYVDPLPPASRVDEIIPYNQTEAPFNITVVDIIDYGCNVTGPVGVCKVEVYYKYSADNETWPADWTLYAVNNSLITHPDGTADNWTLAFTAPEGAGWYRFISIAYDCVGNVEQPPYYHGTYDAECQLIADTEPPVVTKEYGEPNIEIDLGGETAHILTWDTPIYINATDLPDPENASGIDEILISFDGLTWYHIGIGSWTVIEPGKSGSYSVSYVFTPNDYKAPAGPLEEGELVTLFVSAIDKLGHEVLQEDQIKQKFYIDATAPETSIELECTGEMPFNITINATDALAGVKEITLYFRYSPDGSEWTDWMEYGTASGNHTWGFIYNPDGGYYKPGYYEFYAYAEDMLGNAKGTPVNESWCYIAPWAEDFNADGHVGVDDLLLLIANWGKNESSPDWEEVQQYDLDGDGEIGLGDLIMLATKWTG